MRKLKHIFEYIIFLLFTRLLKLFSIDQAANICSLIARNLGPHLKVTKIARNNLKKVYGTKIDIDKTINDLWDNFGRYLGEFAFTNSLSKNELDKRIKIIGLENIKHFQESNQPFLLFLGHQANWDFLIRKINDIYPKFGIIYRKANNPYIDKEILLQRAHDPRITMIEKGIFGARNLLKAIKTGASIAMLVDQKMNNGIEVPFFGMPAMSTESIAILSMQYNYPIIPLQIIRKGKTSYFDMVIHKPLEYSISGDKKLDSYNIILQINKTLEVWIRKYPHQWFWFHNRWKK